ncbi:MAG: hypothetical protein JSU86_14340 [Phycisphaerales bacterium]|nr:MAG: hypothetical protein JSU86_14340 [Phycisphaerales bacterium]
MELPVFTVCIVLTAHAVQLPGDAVSIAVASDVVNAEAVPTLGDEDANTTATADAHRDGEERQDGTFPDSLVELLGLSNEVSLIEHELSETQGFRRDSLLAKFGRSSAASGRFGLAGRLAPCFITHATIMTALDHRPAVQVLAAFVAV